MHFYFSFFPLCLYFLVLVRVLVVTADNPQAHIYTNWLPDQLTVVGVRHPAGQLALPHMIIWGFRHGQCGHHYEEAEKVTLGTVCFCYGCAVSQQGEGHGEVCMGSWKWLFFFFVWDLVIWPNLTVKEAGNCCLAVGPGIKDISLVC